MSPHWRAVAETPVTIQSSPRARRVSTTNRAPMKTAAKATQTATSPPVT